MAKLKEVTYSLEVDVDQLNALGLTIADQTSDPKNTRKMLANALADRLSFPPELYIHYLPRWTENTRIGLERFVESGMLGGGTDLGTIQQEEKWGKPVIVKANIRIIG